MKKLSYLTVALCFSVATAGAQGDVSPMNIGAANFLRITPDARSAAMGGAGVGVDGNYGGIFHNAATVVGNGSCDGMSYTFVPWLRDAESGHNYHALGAYLNIDGRNAVLIGYRDYRYPKIYPSEWGEPAGKSFRPHEMALDLAYARSLTDRFSVSGTVRYIHSDMGRIGDAKKGNAFAFDLGAFYKHPISGMKGAAWAAGLNVANVGTRMKYLYGKERLPVSVALGGSVDLPLNDVHRLIVAADADYRLTPSDVAGVNVSTGLEYVVAGYFKVRGGYHYGDEKKGDWTYYTAGLGGEFRGARIDFTWLFADNTTYIRNTFWVTLGWRVN